MGKINWREIWHRLSQEPTSGAILALVTLNGLSLRQVRELALDKVNTNEGWLTTADGLTFPLVKQAAVFLSTLTEKMPFAASEAVFEALVPLEAEAQRRLAGALWYTSEEGRDIMDAVGV